MCIGKKFSGEKRGGCGEKRGGCGEKVENSGEKVENCGIKKFIMRCELPGLSGLF
jgi:hypothetical protein